MADMENIKTSPGKNDFASDLSAERGLCFLQIDDPCHGGFPKDEEMISIIPYPVALCFERNFPVYALGFRH
jgi:hypothetical protein